MAYLVLSEGSAAKFWSIKIDGSRTHVSYGRIGTKGTEPTATLCMSPDCAHSLKGQQQDKDHGSVEKAKQFAEKMINEKKKKGYEEDNGTEKAVGKKRQSSKDSDDDDDEGSGSGNGKSDGEEDSDEEPKPKVPE